MSSCTEIVVPHAPQTYLSGGADPEEPEFDDVCPVCWTAWPCLIAWLSGLDEVEEQRDRQFCWPQSTPEIEAPF